MLERIVEERVGHALVGTVSVAVDRLAEEIAREALADSTFRRTIRELVRVRSEALLDRLLSNGRATKRRLAPARRASAVARIRSRTHSRRVR
ncbi:MAG TPA: hypothetical protein VFM88_06640 [Vicinamibacteria bacterium]|nr:hypothetical protein [Vicinamibacteria bacterium]